jgi:organic hydroperoxide reductase OsmC/OhrA
MSRHTATIHWARGDAAFTDRRYSRAHAWHFDGGAVVPASSSPQVVRVPFSDASAVDPEEAFVAALSSCHMLWFLDLAAQAGWCVDRYHDEAEGLMQRDAAGHDWIARVVLRPQVAFAGERQPDAGALAELHHRAHESCFLARSVRSEVVVEIPPPGAHHTQLRDSAAPGQR